MATVPEELRKAPALGSIKDMTSMVKSYLDAQSLVGRKGVLVPTAGPETDPEGWRALYTAAGCPEKPEAYAFPEGVPLDETFEREIRAIMQANGVPQRAAFELVKWYAAKQAAFDREEQAELERAVEANNELLRTTYGSDERVAQAKAAASRVLAMFAPDEIKAKLDELPLAHDPHVVMLLNNIAKRFAEDRMFGNGTLGGPVVLTAAEAKAEIDKLKQDRTFASNLANPSSPDHAKAVARWTELHKASAGDQKPGPHGVLYSDG